MGLLRRMYRNRRLWILAGRDALPGEYIDVAYMVEMVVDLIVVGWRIVAERRTLSSLVLKGSLVGLVDGMGEMRLVLVYLMDLMITCLCKFRDEGLLVSLPREILPP
jgi:hypothetical protein